MKVTYKLYETFTPIGNGYEVLKPVEISGTLFDEDGYDNLQNSFESVDDCIKKCKEFIERFSGRGVDGHCSISSYENYIILPIVKFN